MDKKQKVKGILLAIAAMIVSLVVYRIAGAVIDNFVTNRFLRNLLAELCFAIMALISVIVLKKTKIFKTDKKFLKSGLSAAGLLYGVIAFQGFFSLGMLLNTTASFGEILLFIPFCFLIGFCEEVIYRGLVQNAFHDYFGEDSLGHVWCALICSAIVFGASHLTNAFRPGGDIASAAVQAFGTMGMAVFLGAIYFRSHKNIWLLIILHGVFDMVVMIGSGILAGTDLSALLNNYSANFIGALFWNVVYILTSLFLLRPKKVEPLLKKEEE
ncbi:MAG: CPBP family intramembrane metalloprotease [Faecalicoccus sp.]|nr:CPBP family intramembrane metalloprotease [Faecalicoccus sp.]